MLHHLTLGHLNERLINEWGQIAVLRPLDPEIVDRLLREYGGKDAEGNPTLGGYPVEWKDGYVECGWMMPLRVRAAEAFARQLQDETGCVMADASSRRLVSRSEFA
jgi:hypothetical protein